ncbi:NAD-dependent epimerase/dehydratase family protein [Arenicella xantha]|uniref:Nucleoside-diphosphate-sugar epimerase n=1 Tax=Arenicella xantha TaxID=644221 RepID=A0A395JHR6_9GAMM|nr:NAD-dependent epimerase/dehydratase family protein [Arenicella xantha]RBP49626.1 nucleoside-diphosphate-sugar epimerase [Arenicella xantha]
MKQPSKRVLVTGATGFTGGALAKKLVERGDHVVALVRKGANIAPLEQLGVELVFGDITDADAVSKAAQGVQIIYHIAAVFRTAGHPDEYYEAVNIGGVKHVIDAARTHNVARTVHCSTIGVHGDIEELPSNEESPFNPGDIYQRTKLAGEQLFAKAMDDGLPGSIFRPGAIYGPGDLRLLKMFKQIKRGFFPLFGGGTNLYHLSYIDDLTDGIILCGEHPNALGQRFILCSNEYGTLKDLAATIASQLGVKAPTFAPPIGPLMLAAKACEALCRPLGIDPPLHTRRVEFFVKSRAFDNSKAREMIGYQPKISTREGVKRTIKWYQDNDLL